MLAKRWSMVPSWSSSAEGQTKMDLNILCEIRQPCKGRMVSTDMWEGAARPELRQRSRHGGMEPAIAMSCCSPVIVPQILVAHLWLHHLPPLILFTCCFPWFFNLIWISRFMYFLNKMCADQTKKRRGSILRKRKNRAMGLLTGCKSFFRKSMLLF